MMFRHATDLDLSMKAISHQIVLISPGAFRYEPEVSIPSRHIYEILRDNLSGHKLEAAARLYEIFSRDQCIKSSAGYMLEDGYHNVLCKGGQWEIYA